jgi:Protein of unknown function (DUF3306)
MAIDAEDSGFISRWSRRKALVRQGADVAEVAPPVAVVVPVVEPAPALPVVTTEAPAPVAATPAEPTAPPPLTMTDVAALTRDSDYSRFMARGVQPDVKNAALGKLFTDPHFNVMDGLDTYIDDYGKPDPLPEGMLRQMLQAHVLGLFDHEKTDDVDPENKAENKADNNPDNNKTEPSTAAQPPCDAAPTPEPVTDENTDLQLQPDHDAGRPSAAPSTEQDAGCAH